MSFGYLVAGAVAAYYVTPAVASCAHGTSLLRRQEGGEVEVGEFGYIGPNGPANWALLSAENQLCANGQSQSPINLVEGAFQLVPAADVAFQLPDLAAGAEFENIGTTVEVVAPGGALNFDGIDYTMAQFHFHLPSEHLDGSASQAMEMHMVWESEAGQVAVISAFIDVDDSAGLGNAAAPIANVTAPPAAGHELVVEPPAAAEPPAVEHPVVVEPPAAAEPPAVEHPVVVEPPAAAPPAVVESPPAMGHTPAVVEAPPAVVEHPAAAPPAVIEAPPAMGHTPAAVEAPPASAPIVVHPGAIPVMTHARRSVAQKNGRREVAKNERRAKQVERRQLGNTEGQLFAVPEPLAVVAGPSVLIETVMASVSEITVPGTKTLTQALDISELQTALAAGNFRTYVGSLTTPPCTEGVRWLISDQKLVIQSSTFISARNVIGFNARFPQNAIGGQNVLLLAQAGAVVAK